MIRPATPPREEESGLGTLTFQERTRVTPSGLGALVPAILLDFLPRDESNQRS